MGFTTARGLSGCSEQTLLFIACAGLHTAAVLAAEHGLRPWAPAAAERVLSGCGLWALECWVGRRGMGSVASRLWNRPRLERDQTGIPLKAKADS